MSICDAQRKSDIRQSEVLRIWRESHCLCESSIRVYLRWIRRYKVYCHHQGLDETTQLTASGVNTFAEVYAREQSIRTETAKYSARSALYAWAQALIVLGHTLPRWRNPPCSAPALPPLLSAFVDYLHQHRGNAPRTVVTKISHISDFQSFIRTRGRELIAVQLTDIDAYIVDRRKHDMRTTVASRCCSLRSFLQFLYVTGRLEIDLASLIIAPVVRKGERPLRSLAWDDVQAILQAIDRSTPGGQRDYALLLMMSMYGLGAGEVLGLTLDSINWSAATVRIKRPKTAIEVVLPLLPAIAQALVIYLRQGRPIHAVTRHLFVRMKAPYKHLSNPSSIRHIIVKYAELGGVTSPYLGSHVLRHSHARQQIELGTSAHVISDILGHQHPESTTAYIRIAAERLRELALPVPL